MIWSDMYITANTNDGYYDVAPNTDCSLWEKPEKELGLVYWDYYHHEKADYEKMLQVHKQLSKQIIFAGGSWIWNGIAPNYSKTFASTKAALEACKKYDIKEVLCTAWMDLHFMAISDFMRPMRKKPSNKNLLMLPMLH